jgi:hypothetical protein
MVSERLEQRQQTILDQTANIRARLADVSAAIAEAGVVVTGSRGQQVPNRLLGLERTLQMDLARLERELITVEQQLDQHRRVERANAIIAAAHA